MVRSSGFVLLVVLFVVRSLGSCFWSFFSWFVLWVRAFGRSFRGSFFGFVLLVVLFVVRSSVRAFRSFFSWFVLLVRAFGHSFVVRAFGRSFRGSFFCSFFWSFFLWFVLLGARMCFLFDALKVLEACVARS